MLKSQLTISLILLSLLSFAQDSTQNDLYDMSLEELSKISVSSSKRISTEIATRASANVMVITQSQINERGYLSLADLLEDLPDVKVDRAVDPRWFNDVTMRGVRYSDKFIILLDGIRISSPTNEIIPIMENYPLHFVKQVEVVYGPVSALYGADAFVGVINLISKETNKNGNLSGGFTGSQYNGFNGNLLLSTQLKSGIDVMVSGHYFHDEQPDLAKFYRNTFIGRDQSLRTGTFYTFLGTIQPNTPVDPQAGFPLDASSFFSRIRFKDFSLTHFRNHAHSPSSTANNPQNSVYNEDQFFGHRVSMTTLRFHRQSAKWISNSQVTHSTYQLDPLSNFRNVFTLMEPAYLYARSWKFKAEQLFTYVFSSSVRLTGGITTERYFSIPRSNDLIDPVKNDNLSQAVIINSQAPNNPNGIPAELIETEYTSNGGLLELNLTPGKEWNFTIGSRLDKDQRYDLTINPRVGAVYTSEGGLIAKALFGTAFLAPSPQNIYDRYGIVETNDNGNTYFSNFYNLPNTQLEPQTISTWELGAKYFFARNLSLDVSSYYSRVTNLISPVSSEVYPERIDAVYPGMTYEIGGQTIAIDEIQINDNLGESTILGGSILLNYLLRAERVNADIYLSYSYVDGTTDVDEEGPAVERNLPGVAPHQIKFGGTVRTGKFTASIRANIVGKQRAFSFDGVKDANDNGNVIDDDEYTEIDGYVLLNANISYNLSNQFSLLFSGRNLLDQRYRNVNIGTGDNSDSFGGSAQAEFRDGAPQNPLRISMGIKFSFN